MRALAPAAAPLARTCSCSRRPAAQRHAPRLPRAHAVRTARAKPAGARDDGSELLADVVKESTSASGPEALTRHASASAWYDSAGDQAGTNAAMGTAPGSGAQRPRTHSPTHLKFSH